MQPNYPEPFGTPGAQNNPVPPAMPPTPQQPVQQPAAMQQPAMEQPQITPIPPSPQQAPPSMPAAPMAVPPAPPVAPMVQPDIPQTPPLPPQAPGPGMAAPTSFGPVTPGAPGAAAPAGFQPGLPQPPTPAPSQPADLFAAPSPIPQALQAMQPGMPNVAAQPYAPAAGMPADPFAPAAGMPSYAATPYPASSSNKKKTIIFGLSAIAGVIVIVVIGVIAIGAFSNITPADYRQAATASSDTESKLSSMSLDVSDILTTLDGSSVTEAQFNTQMDKTKKSIEDFKTSQKALSKQKALHDHTISGLYKDYTKKESPYLTSVDSYVDSMAKRPCHGKVFDHPGQPQRGR